MAAIPSTMAPKSMEYVILSTPEEDALSNYFLMLSRFAFDTARDQVVRRNGIILCVVMVTMIVGQAKRESFCNGRE